MNYREMRTEVSLSDFTDGKHKDFKKILLRRITQKPSNFSAASRDNFTETLRYALIKQGYKVDILKEELLQKSSGKPDTNIFSPESNLELNKETIRDLVQSSPEIDLFIDGYIYEKDLGNIIDPDFSIGIILKLYNNEGLLIGEGILSSYYSVSDFEVTQMYARLLTKKISTNVSQKKLTWIPFLNK